MNKKGFTLVELLGVIIILSIIMLIAIPNITSILNKSKNDTYLTDARKLITQAEYLIRSSKVDKPASNQLLKITLSYLGTKDVSKDSDGNSYSLTDSYVVVVRKDGYLEYYVQLVATTDSGNKGIRLVHEDELQSDDRMNLIQKNIVSPSNSQIYTITGVTGTIQPY